jgi:hypothetical protein
LSLNRLMLRLPAIASNVSTPIASVR